MLRLGPLALAALVGLIVLDGRFVYDDSSLLVENPVVNGEVAFWEAFVRDFWGRASSHGFITWRPLMPLVWAQLWTLWPGEPLPFRVLGLLLHVFAVATGVVFVHRLSESRERALLVGVLFAVHPLNTEAVSAIAGQADVASFALVLIACTIALRPATWRSGLLCALWFLVAELVKESAVIFTPLAALLFSLRPGLIRAKCTAVLPVVVVAVAVVTFQLALPRAAGVAMITSNLAHSAEGGARLLLGLHNAGRALAMTAWPHPIAPNHGYAAVELQTDALLGWGVVGATLLLLGAAGLAWAIRRRRLEWVAALCFVYAPAVLQTHWLVRLVTDLAERLLYPSVFGFSMLIAIGLSRVSVSRRVRSAAVVGTAALLLAVSLSPRRAWTDEDALWIYAVRAEPRAALHHHNVSNTHFRRGDLDEGAYHRLLYTYLVERFPEPVPWSAIEALELRTPAERFLELPDAVAPGNPCALIRSFRTTAALYEPLDDYVLQRWPARYPQCFPGGVR
jgi:hypothetical protein